MVDSRNAGNIVFRQCADSCQPRYCGERRQGSCGVLERTLDIGRIGLSAEMLGSMQEVFERTVEYMKQRTQFGVQIGAFQALQHRAAIMYSEIELCRVIGPQSAGRTGSR
jgi:alkylation response protein AidB-like acyl-CoA dehydrogenase